MTWIKSDESLAQHPKVDEVAEKLSIDPAQVIGHLHYLWWWATNYAEDGNLTKYEKRIAKASRVEFIDNDTYVDVLVTAGFLDRVGDTLIIHDWEDYHGELIKKRSENAKRQRKARQISKEIAEVNSEVVEAEIVEGDSSAVLFKAIYEVCTGKAYEPGKKIPEDNRGRINNAVVQLRDSGATYDEVHKKGFNYFLEYGKRPTPQALTGNWEYLDEHIPQKQAKAMIKQAEKQQSNNALDEWAKS